MRVLFAIRPLHAHLWPVAPVAWALQSAGHEVRVASPARFAGSIRAAGLTPVALGNPSAEEARTRTDARAPARPEEVLAFAGVLGLTEAEREHWIVFHQWLLNPISDYLRTDLPYAPDLVEFGLAWRPDLVLWEPTMAAAAVAARACGAAHARFLLGLDYPGWCFDRLARHRDAVAAAGLPGNPQADLLRPLAHRYGVDIRADNGGSDAGEGVDHELLYGQWSIDPMPTGIALPTTATTLPVRHVPYTGAEVFPEWLYERPDRPRVALTLGESARRFVKGDWGRAPKIFEAVAGLDIEVIAILNNRQLEGIEKVPDNVRTIDWVSLTHLLPTCSAAIHHGGGGTFAAPCAFNLPQIVCDTDESLLMRPVGDPSIWQLPAKRIESTPAADYVTERGAGARLDHRVRSVDEITAMVHDVVTGPSYRAGAQAVFDSGLATPSPGDIVALLERLTAERRRG